MKDLILARWNDILNILENEKLTEEDVADILDAE